MNSEPVHESDTCVVHFATDMKKSANDSNYHVALKIMFNEDNFIRELQARISIEMSDIKPGDDIIEVEMSDIKPDVDITEVQNKYESEHVVPLHRYHNDAELKNEKKCWCLVLAKGSKSISQIIHSERIAGIKTDKLIKCGVDLAKAIQHMHEKNMIHADIKPRNVIRDTAGDFKLIDLDASVEIGEKLTDKKKSTAFMSPELAKAEFFSNESVEELEKRRKEKRKELRELDDDNEAKYEEITLEIRELKRKIKMCNQEGNDTIKAKKSIDIWGFGVTMYNFFTNGEPLFRCNESYDTLYDEVEKCRLVNWDGLSFEELDKILPEYTDMTLSEKKVRRKAQKFFMKCLHGDINQRHENTEAILDDPLFSMNRYADSSVVMNLRIP